MMPCFIENQQKQQQEKGIMGSKLFLMVISVQNML